MNIIIPIKLIIVMVMMMRRLVRDWRDGASDVQQQHQLLLRKLLITVESLKDKFDM